MIKLKNKSSSKQGKCLFQGSTLHCLLVSVRGFLGGSDCCKCFVFKYCQTAHVACTFAELLEKINSRTNKKLEDGSNMVKSGYGAMIKLENELSKQGQCWFDWSNYVLFNIFSYFVSQIYQNLTR